MSSAFSIDFLEPTSEFQTHVTFLLVDKNTKGGYLFLSWIAKKILVTSKVCRDLLKFSLSLLLLL